MTKEDVVRRHCSHGVVSGQGEIHLGGDKGPPPSPDLTDRLGSAPRATRHHTNTAAARSNGCYPNILHKIHPGAGVILFLSVSQKLHKVCPSKNVPDVIVATASIYLLG